MYEYIIDRCIYIDVMDGIAVFFALLILLCFNLFTVYSSASIFGVEVLMIS